MDSTRRVRGSIGRVARYRVHAASQRVTGAVAQKRREAQNRKTQAIRKARMLDFQSPHGSFVPMRPEQGRDLKRLGCAIQHAHILEICRKDRDLAERPHSSRLLSNLALRNAEDELARRSQEAKGPVFDLVADYVQAGGSFEELIEAVSEKAWTKHRVFDNYIFFAKGFRGEHIELHISGVDETTGRVLKAKEIDAIAQRKKYAAMRDSFYQIWDQTSLHELARPYSGASSDRTEQRKRLTRITAATSKQPILMTRFLSMAPAAFEVREGMQRLEKAKELDHQAAQFASKAKKAKYKEAKKILKRNAADRRLQARQHRLQGLAQATRGSLRFYGKTIEAPSGLLRFSDFEPWIAAKEGPDCPRLLPVVSTKKQRTRLGEFEKLGLMVEARYDVLAKERTAGFKKRPKLEERQKIAQVALSEGLQDFAAIAKDPIITRLLEYLAEGKTLRDLVAQIADPSDLQVYDQQGRLHFEIRGFSGETIEFDLSKRDTRGRLRSDKQIERAAKKAQKRLLYLSLLNTLGVDENEAESWASKLGKAAKVTKSGARRRLRTAPRRALNTADYAVNGADSTAGGLSVGDIQFGAVPGGNLLDFAVVLSILPAALDVSRGMAALDDSDSMESRAAQLEKTGSKEDLVEAKALRKQAAKKRRQARGQVVSGGMTMVTSSATSAGGLAGMVGLTGASAGLGILGGGLGVAGGGIAGVLALRNLGKGMVDRSKLSNLRARGRALRAKRKNHYELLAGQLCVDYAKTQSFYANTKIATSLMAAGAAGGTLVGSGCLIGLAIGSLPSGPSLGSSVAIGLGVGAGVGLGGAVALGVTSVGTTVARKGYFNYKQARLADTNPLKTELGIQARTYMMLEIELEAKAKNPKAPSIISTQIAARTAGMPADVYLKFLEPSFKAFVKHFPEEALKLEKQTALCAELIGA